MSGEAMVEELREQWTDLYRKRLPALAKARDPAQKRWPVYLDHCFARIVLDNAVGVDKPWTEVLMQPAVKNMSAAQLQDAIKLGERLATGDADLVELDERSLQLRGKKSKRTAEDTPKACPPSKKKRQSEPTISAYFLPSPASPQKEEKSKDSDPGAPEVEASGEQHDPVDIEAELRRIADSDITPFRKQMLTLLCQVPRGRYSTYQAMSDHITKTSHKTCARAVGSAMRNNPFAPEVPCHRILAADGTLGGFGGHWGENGKFANKKHELLYKEGVRFDSKGKVKGPPFRDFT